MDNDGSIKTDNNDVLNKWKNDFHTLFQRNGTRDIGLDNSEFNTEIDVSLLNGPINRDEVLQAVLLAKLWKAAEIDDIPAEVLKNDVAVNLLLQIISGCFNLWKVPVQWNSGIINPIFKQGSDDDR